MNLESILARIEPSPDESTRLQATVDALLAATRAAMTAAGLRGTPSVQGSVAKGTWLAGNMDVDLFLLLDPETPADALKEAAFEVGQRVLEHPQTKYAQHPYLVGRFQGIDVDLVPAYAVPEASAHMSAVDRTPFHTQWVKANTDADLRRDIRLAKQWCKGVGIYGADTATGGFSGYLVEVLLVVTGGFLPFIQWLAAGAAAQRVAWGDDAVADASPLVVVDPVDAARNCGAAVQSTILARAAEAAQAYLDAPTQAFFFPAPARLEPEACRAALGQQDAAWMGLTMIPRTDRLDIVLPQFQRAARTLSEAATRAGFPVRRHQVDVVDGQVCMQWVTDDVTLSQTILHTGPRAGQQPNADRFCSKWEGHPDALGPVHETEGRLCIEVRRTARTPAAWLAQEAPRFQGGKHVVAALRHHEVHTRVPSGSWGPLVTEFILDRRPWQR